MGGQKKFKYGLTRAILNDSHCFCTLLRCVYLLCSLFGLSLFVQRCLHLHTLRQSASLLLAAFQILVIACRYYIKEKSPPSFTKLFSNNILKCFLIFHIYTLCGFRWNMDIYILIALFLIWSWNLSNNALNKKAFYQDLWILITVLGTTKVILMISQGAIEIDWIKILVFPISILFTLGICLFIIGISKRFYRYWSRDRKIVPLFQTIICFMTFNSLFFAYYLLILKQFVIKQVYDWLVNAFMITSFFIFVLGPYFEEELIMIFCGKPKSVYRRSQTIFEQMVFLKKWKSQIEWEAHYCVLCYRQCANVWYNACQHMSYCEVCHLRMKKKNFRYCPICKQDFFIGAHIQSNQHHGNGRTICQNLRLRAKSIGTNISQIKNIVNDYILFIFRAIQMDIKCDHLKLMVKMLSAVLQQKEGFDILSIKCVQYSPKCAFSQYVFYYEYLMCLI